MNEYNTKDMTGSKHGKNWCNVYAISTGLERDMGD